MPVSERDRAAVDALFRAMQAGPLGEDALMALFADDAVLVEPFGGQVRTHSGHTAIRASFRETWKDPLPDMDLQVERVDQDGGRVRAEWTCASSAFPAPMRGFDLFDVHEGKIRRLEIVVTDMPGGPPA